MQCHHHSSTEILIISPQVEVPSCVTSALDIKDAISNVNSLPALGFSPTLGNIFKHDYELEKPDENQPEDEEFVFRNEANEVCSPNPQCYES